MGTPFMHDLLNGSQGFRESKRDIEDRESEREERDTKEKDEGHKIERGQTYKEGKR